MKSIRVAMLVVVAVLLGIIALVVTVYVTKSQLPSFDELKSSPNGQMIRVLADDVFVPAKSLLPIRISENQFRLFAWLVLLGWKKQAAQIRLHTQSRKVIPRDVGSQHLVGAAIGTEAQ